MAQAWLRRDGSSPRGESLVGRFEETHMPSVFWFGIFLPIILSIQFGLRQKHYTPGRKGHRVRRASNRPGTLDFAVKTQVLDGNAPGMISPGQK